MLQILGGIIFSDFQCQHTLHALQRKAPRLTSFTARYVYCIDIATLPNDAQKQQLHDLLLTRQDAAFTGTYRSAKLLGCATHGYIFAVVF